MSSPNTGQFPFRRSLRVLGAPDKFKGFLTAIQAAEAIAAGTLDTAPYAIICKLPVADGGEGTIEAAAAAGATIHTLDVHGPLGQLTKAKWALLNGTSIVEMAQAAGLQKVTHPTPDTAEADTTFGVGELIIDVLNAGIREIVIGAGFVAGPRTAIAPGAQLVGELVGLEASIAESEPVVVAEGSLDAHSLEGKAPVAIAQASQRIGIPVLPLAGQIQHDARRQFPDHGTIGTACPLDLADEEDAIAHAQPLLRTLAARTLKGYLSSWTSYAEGLMTVGCP